MSEGEFSPHGDHNYPGVYSAIVTQNDLPGGMVKVRFSFLANGDVDQSAPAPVVTSMVGAGFGAYFLPEVGDEVYVMFIAGNFDQPIVVGGSWSEVDPPPECNEDGKNDFRLVKSRSGHRMLLDDSDQTKVVFTDRKDENVIAAGSFEKGGSSAQNAYKVPTPKGVEGQPAEGVCAAAMSGNLNVWCPNGTLKIEAGKSIEVTGVTSVDMKAESNVTATAPKKIGVGGGSGGGMQGKVTKIGIG